MSDSITLGHRIGQMAPYLQSMLEGAELAHPWPAQVVEQLGGIDHLRRLLANPLGPTANMPREPIEQFADLLKRLEDAGNDPLARNQARRDLMTWAEVWVKAYAEVLAKGG